ncbi:MAG: hypothetical protein AAF512_07535 [Pseudomonadota bacterium]
MDFSEYAGYFPPEIAGYFFAQWDRQQIWALNIGVQTDELEQFTWHLQYPFWSTQPPQPLFDLPPAAVLKNPNRYPIHKERIARADLKHPIDVAEFGGRLVILDGLHRLAHAMILKKTHIAFRVIPKRYLQV